MSNKRVRVLYITGSPRSGSTILSKTLGQVPGFFHAGELRFLWDKNFIDGFPCECGDQLQYCSVWSGVFNSAYGGFDQIDPEVMLGYREKYTRTKHMPKMLTRNGKQRLELVLEEYLSNLDRLYVAISEITGSDVIIDSSKFSSYGYILSMLPSIEVYYLHLIRDSRAVAYSRLKKKKWDETGIYMARYGPLRSSAQWSILNISSEVFQMQFPDNYLQIRYEDFIDHPQSTVEEVTKLAGLIPQEHHFIGPNTIEVTSSHTNWGNPIRNNVGQINLRLDDEWRIGLGFGSKTIVFGLTLPLLLRYKYI
jgi:hypothetical protein